MSAAIEYRRVWLAVFDPAVHCADLAIEVLPNLRISRCALRYTPEYLSHPAAFALDPVHFPLGTQEHHTNALPGVIQDALPDRWGRYIRHKLYGVPPNDDVAHLDARRGAGVGALLFSRPDEAAPELSLGLAWKALPTARRELNEAGHSPPAAEVHQALLDMQAGSSAGGARPKLLCTDAHGQALMVKFRAREDSFDVVRSEFKAMQAAAAVQISVAAVKLRTVAGEPVLAVSRFDCPEPRQRIHMVSFASLLGDPVAASWGDLVELVRRFSVQPEQDYDHLFRRMLFDIHAHNIDNHLRNFCLLNDGRGWRLSPSYDLVPHPREGHYHFLSFDGSAVPPTDLRGFLSFRRNFYISEAQAQAAIRDLEKLDRAQHRWVQPVPSDSRTRKPARPGARRRHRRAQSHS